MKEIKFRAWDKRFNRMQFGAGDLLLRVNDTDHSQPMQYTGLKDKNGKEIYEGDVVSIKAFEPRSNIVRFDRGGFCLEPILVAPLHSSFWSDIKYAEDDRSEVIGNIYENPELLTN